MFNILKRKQTDQPTIDFWPVYEGLTEHTPIVPAKNYLPDWWKKLNVKQDVLYLENKTASAGTIKRCPGIIDILNHGWVMPAWCDMAVKVKGHEKLEWDVSDTRFSACGHQHNQFLDHLPESTKQKYYWVFKPSSPWYVQTSPGYSIMQLDPFYFFNEYFDSAGGIQDSDFYHNLNPLLLIKKDCNFVIERGTPLAVIYPYKREEIKGTCREHNRDKITKLQAADSYISKSKFSPLITYKEEQHKRKKCPFHF